MGELGEVNEREWGEFGKKVMEFRRRLSEREQAMLDEVLSAAFQSGTDESDVEGFGLTTGSHVNREYWPAEPPPYLRRG